MSLEAALEAHGLHLRGVVELNDEDFDRYDFDRQYRSVALIGNIGSSYWSDFSQSAEFSDGEADPLDRWSRRGADEIAGAFALQPLFPFEGPPYYPFQSWARRAEGLDASPLGILIHPELGLWHSYRFALLCDLPASSHVADSPCLTCTGRECITTCPANAVSENGYDYQRCTGYLLDHLEAPCHQQGCVARYACPVAQKRQYFVEQSRFHLSASLDSLL